jgi:hypothetical protein
LEFYGVKGKAKLWFESYLSNRYQRALITSTNFNLSDFSTRGKIEHGVPPGSNLGPFLVLFYINNLPETINDKTVPILFADDTSLLVTSPNYNDLRVNINTAFCGINECFKVNKLTINLNKTHLIQFTASNDNSKTEIKISYDNKQITTISNIKFLGIHIDYKMSWKCYIEHISSKLSTVCYIIRSIKRYTFVNTLKTVYSFYFKFNYKLWVTILG